MFSDGYEAYCHDLIEATFIGSPEGDGFSKNACDCILNSLVSSESTGVK